MVSQLTRDRPKARVSGAALDELMARHDGLVHAVLRRQFGGSLSYGERLQVGRIGLWHALVGYDSKRGTALSTYAWPAIQREIWRAVRQRGALPTTPTHPLPLPLPDRSAVFPSDLDETLLAAERVSTLYALVNRLPSALRQVVVAYYGLDDASAHSLCQLAQELDVSHETVRLRLLAALVWLRHPAHSLALRQLLGRNTLSDYQYADALAQRFLRRRGGRR